jgi:DNA-binding NtrC family response regulator
MTGGKHPSSQRLIGASPELRRVLSAARIVAATEVNVLIVGESGTGKQLLAHEIHRLGSHAARACVTVACAGLSEEGLQEHLDAGTPGKPGTLILTEVADLSADGQALLLRHLAAWEATHSPSRRWARVIATTSRDLAAEVGLGAFRRDLYYHLCIVPLELPPLRDRPGDIPLLLEGLGSQAARTHGQRPPRYTVMALRLLRRYTWPGNLRELRNLCERMAILSPGREVAPEDLPLEIRRGDAPRGNAPGFQLPSTGINLNDLEAELIRQALALAAGNKSRAARLLGLTRDTLLYRMEKHLIKA